MKRIFIAALALCLMGFSSCGKDESKPHYEKPTIKKEDTKKEETKQEPTETEEKEESNFDEVLFYNTETDGDKIFTFPADYKTEKEGVKYGEVKYLPPKKRNVFFLIPLKSA